jgi:hypothetical protein
MADSNAHGTFNELIDGFDPDIQAIAKALRSFIASMHGDFVEVAWPRQKIASYGIGPKKGMVQKRPFSGNTRARSADPDRSPRWSGFTRVSGCRAGASVPREPGVPQKFQPVCVQLTGQ